MEETRGIFIVGLARSGTTLLQSMLANSPNIYSFPESHFFRATLPKQAYLRPFKLFGKEDELVVKRFLDSLDLSNLFEAYKGSKTSRTSWTQYLLDTYRNMSHSAQKQIWLEKTPMHLHFVKLIAKVDPTIHFVQIIRNPVENIAALYQVGQEHEGHFKKQSLENVFQRFTMELHIMESNARLPNVHVVHYEDLVTNTEESLKELCQKLHLKFNPSMLDHQSKVQDIAVADETWKAGNSDHLTLSLKAKSRLTQAQYTWLVKKVNNINAKLLERYSYD